MKEILQKVCLVVCLLISAHSHALTALYYKSEPGDYIGQGQELLLTTNDVDFSVGRNFDNGIYFNINNFNRNIPPMNFIWWYLNLAAPFNQTLTPGSYENATRWPFQATDRPGLDFSGSGRGCNQLAGRFEILEVVYDASGNVTKFAANFEQHCELFMPPLLGMIRYNSDVPMILPAIAKITLRNSLNRYNCVEATGPDGALITVDGLASRDSQNGTNLSYSWSTTTGLSGSGPEFSFGLGVNQNATVSLTVTDLDTSKQSGTTRNICVSDTTPPNIVINSPVSGETLVGGALIMDVTITDLVDKNIQNYDVFMGSLGTYAIDPETGSSRIRLLQPAADEGPLAMTLQVRTRDASGNVGNQTITVYKAHNAR